ncbi:MAG TPA: hypothetical protein VGQ64_12870 [Candidatus Limnocylindrales bacterium]|nr:hypothetical protein [Candidatus Limnocylindrales bacterium]
MMARAKKNEDDQSLRRLGGGRWQTRDERFTIEPQSGTWVIVDAEQTDDLGLPLVRGPFRSLTDAKAAIEGARAGGPTESPLAERLDEARRRPASKATPATKRTQASADAKSTPTKQAARRSKSGSNAAPETPPEPGWIAGLGPAERRRARQLIEKLDVLGIRDAEGLVRRDLVGNVPSIASVAVANHLAGALGRATSKGTRSPADLLEDLVKALVDGKDEELDVRWRLVDDDGRPIGLTARDIRAALERTETR